MFCFEDVSFRVRENTILEKISFEIINPQIIGVIGPSGSGKSTILRLCNKLISPTSGIISLNGKDISIIDSLLLRKKIGLVFQRPYLFQGTVRENLLYGPKLWGEIKTKKELENLLNNVSLSNEFLDKDITHLSGGEQQRVSLARTLANNPTILLLDEPTSALDIVSEKIVEETLLNLQKKGVPILLVSHSLEQAQRLSDRILILKEGFLVKDTLAQPFFENCDYIKIQEFFKKPIGHFKVVD